MKKLIVTVTGAACLSFGAGALANDGYVMTYTKDELSTFAGVQNVHERIVKAAKQYCPTYSQIRSKREVQSCIDDVVTDLVQKVDHPRLTDYDAGDNRFRVASTAERGDSSS